MLWEVMIRPSNSEIDREGIRLQQECSRIGANSISAIQSARGFLLQGPLEKLDVIKAADELLADPVVETYSLRELTQGPALEPSDDLQTHQATVLFKPGVTDNVAMSTLNALKEMNIPLEVVATCRNYHFNADATRADQQRCAERLLANDAIEYVMWGPLQLESISLGSKYDFELITVPIREMNDPHLETLSKQGQLYLNLTEMQTIQKYFIELDRDPTDIELETVAQTWSEHCSHKTLAGRIHYQDEQRELQFENMLKETIFAATMQIRKTLGNEDWCVSVFEDNAGIVKFDEQQNVCFKAETHNHPSALEPYGGANTGIGGVIRDPLGTGLGARPICSTDVFCFAPPDIPLDDLPPGVLHPQAVMRGVVAGVRDYGNCIGIPTVNGSVYFDERYLGNPLVYCGNVAMIPVDQCEKKMQPGDLIVAVGGRTGRDGIHGATFSSAELTHESEALSGGAVQIGNPVMEKMVIDVILEARDRGLFSAITDCGAGGFSSAVGEMGEKTGAEVWLDRAPLKYEGLSYTEIWISEAQERMVLAVPPKNWEAFHNLCAAEGVTATVLGEFTDTRRLVLKYHDQQVADIDMAFLHDGRPPVIRKAVYQPKPVQPLTVKQQGRYDSDLSQILGALNVASKEWIIRQYDHEVQAGSVIKPLVGVACDGPSDAAVVRPDLNSNRGLVISNGMNPRYGDLDPYWMAASAIDEAVRNCVAVGADPKRIAILDNFCWGNTDRPEVLGSLVRAALACQEFAIAYQTPFISGKDSLNNEFSYVDSNGDKQTVVIPPSLLISAVGQIHDVQTAVTMDLKQPGNLIYLIGETRNEMGGSHYTLIHDLKGGALPQVDARLAPQIFQALHHAIVSGQIESCHDLSEGGLAVAAAEMAFAGECGLALSLSAIASHTGMKEAAVILFAESNTRFLVEVSPDNATAFENGFSALPLTKLGKVTDSDSVVIADADGNTVVDSKWSELKTAWKAPLAWN